MFYAQSAITVISGCEFVLKSFAFAETSVACWELLSTGGSRISTTRTALPAKLVLKPVLPVKSAIHKLTIDTNKPPVSLNDIFPGKSVRL